MKWGRIVLTGVLLTSLAGCGEGELPVGPTVPVSGTVKFGGTAVAEGSVVFDNVETGASRAAKLQSDGSFSIAEVPVGKYAVSVVPPEAAPASDPGKPNAAPDPANIPKKYRGRKTSDLTAEVKQGAENKFPFDLK